MAERKLLDARKHRAKNTIEVDLGFDEDGNEEFVLCRKEDITALVFEGRMPMPMLTAVQKMIDMPKATPMERIDALGKQNGQDLIDLMREHACRVSVTPKIVMADDGNPDHLPVSFFSTEKLMLIWNATAVIPRVGLTTAATFRSGAAPDDAAPVANVTGLPPVTQHLDTPEVTLISG